MSLALARGRVTRRAGEGPVGALVLHGFTGTPAVVAPIATALEAAGVLVEAPLLPGHGGSATDLERTNYADWLAAAEELLGELTARCATVLVVGHSMGGTLALELAVAHPELGAVAVINPLVEPPDRSLLELLGRALESGVALVPFAGADIANRALGYVGATEAPISSLLTLLEATYPLAERLGAIEAPVLVISSRVDHVVPPSTGEFLVARLNASHERVVLEESFHLAPIDFDAERVAARITALAHALATPR